MHSGPKRTILVSRESGVSSERRELMNLPQLINVLLGDMSIIGPRSERPKFVMEFNEQIPGFIERLCVKPGLTGWAQVNGGYDVKPAEKLALDLYYIENRSVKLDILIMIKTICVMFSGSGAR